MTQPTLFKEKPLTKVVSQRGTFTETHPHMEEPMTCTPCTCNQPKRGPGRPRYGKNRRITIQVIMDPDLRDQLDTEAESRGMKRTTLIEQILEAHIWKKRKGSDQDG